MKTMILATVVKETENDTPICEECGGRIERFYNKQY